MTELRKWKLTFQEQHKLEVRKERERHAAQAAGLKLEMESLKELLRTYETSSQRKDEVTKQDSSAFASPCCADGLMRLDGVVVLLRRVAFSGYCQLEPGFRSAKRKD